MTSDMRDRGYSLAEAARRAAEIKGWPTVVSDNEWAVLALSGANAAVVMTLAEARDVAEVMGLHFLQRDESVSCVACRHFVVCKWSQAVIEMVEGPLDAGILSNCDEGIRAGFLKELARHCFMFEAAGDNVEFAPEEASREDS